MHRRRFERIVKGWHSAERSEFACSRDPSRRPNLCREVCLRRPMDATATGKPQQIRPPRRKRRRLTLASLGTIVLLAGAVWLYRALTIVMAERAARRAVAAGRW